jgi:hypothetical protein
MFAGVDTHKDTLAVAVIDHAGRVVRQLELPNPGQRLRSTAGPAEQPQRGAGGRRRVRQLRLAGGFARRPGVSQRHAHRPRSPASSTTGLQTFDIAGLSMTTVAPAIAYAGAPTSFAPPRRWGPDTADWS